MEASPAHRVDDAAHAGLVLGELRAQVQRRSAGEQEPAQHGTERLGGGAQAEIRGHGFGRRIGLLGREAALLDRERGRVARGVDAARAGHAAVGVDRDEAVVVAGQALDPRALERGQGDRRVRGARLRPRRAWRRRRRSDSTRPCANSIPRSRSSRPVAADAAPPKSWSGAASGDTIRIATSSAPRSRSSIAVMIASS